MSRSRLSMQRFPPGAETAEEIQQPEGEGSDRLRQVKLRSHDSDDLHCRSMAVEMHQGHLPSGADQQTSIELVELLDKYLWAQGGETKFLFHGEDVTPVLSSVSNQVLAASTPNIPASLACYPDFGLDAALQEDQEEPKVMQQLGAKIAHIKKTNQNAWQLAHRRLLLVRCMYWTKQNIHDIGNQLAVDWASLIGSIEWRKLPTAVQQSSTPSFEKLELQHALPTLRKAQAEASVNEEDSLEVTLVTSVESNGFPGSKRSVFLDAQRSLTEVNDSLEACLPKHYVQQKRSVSSPISQLDYIYQFGHPDVQQRPLKTAEDLRGLSLLLKGREKVLIWHEVMWQESLASRAKWVEIKESILDVQGWEIFDPVYNPVYNPASLPIDLDSVDLGVKGRSYSGESQGPEAAIQDIPTGRPVPQTRSGAKKAAEAMRK